MANEEEVWDAVFDIAALELESGEGADLELVDVLIGFFGGHDPRREASELCLSSGILKMLSV